MNPFDYDEEECEFADFLSIGIIGLCSIAIGFCLSTFVIAMFNFSSCRFNG